MVVSDTLLDVRAKPDMKTFEMTGACRPIRKLKLFALFIPNLYGFSSSKSERGQWLKNYGN